MSKHTEHRCDLCTKVISHVDEDGLRIYGTRVEGSLKFGFSAKSPCGSTHVPGSAIVGGEFCSSSCARTHIERSLDKTFEGKENLKCGF